ncbi:MAG TPA: enoyl-CoA hydratase-related protein [Candidatus Limnocylindria bacterium]|jgi:2-(1,2-epoxy-1,2-dihydrophenyl)acetyl-CoA isomerase
MPDQPTESLLTAHDDGVLTLTLNRPDALNALNAELRAGLLAAFKAASRDPATRAVVLTGAGRAFCAGADLRGSDAERDFRAVLTAEYNPLIEAIRTIPKPVVAAVNGVAAGAGFSLAMAADLVVVAAEARFVPAFARIGLVPDSGLARTLVRAVGRHRAFAILVDGGQLGADEAQALGLVTAVVASAQLMATAGELARRLGEGPTAGIGFTKRLLNAAEDATLSESLETEAALQALAGRTDDHAEGIAAFAEKRDPAFGGR